MGHFGDKFREAREKKDLTLDQVSNVTKISSRMLKAIEEEHFDQLPGGVFNKGFIRAYAKHLGLNDEEAVTEYITCLREAQVDAHEVWEPEPIPVAPPVPAKKTQPEASQPKPRSPAPKPVAPKPQGPVQVEELPDLQLPRAEDVRPPRRDVSGRPYGTIPWRLVVVAAITVVLALILWTRHSRAERPATAMANTQPTANQASPGSAASSPAPAQPVTKSAPAPSSSVTPTAQAAVTSPPAQPASTPHPAAAASSTPAGEVTKYGDVTIRKFDKSVSKSQDKESTSLTLVIRASENSWVSVLADGQVVTQETLIAPANTSVRASRQITVRIGNAAGISFLFNGQDVPAQGVESEVKTFVFDASGFKTVPSQP